MHKFTLWIFYCLLILFSGNQVSASEQQFSDMRQAYINSIAKEDHGALSGHFDSAGELLLQANPTIVGRANVANYFAAFFERFDIESYSRDTVNTIEMGVKTAEIGRYSLRLKNVNGDIRSIDGSYLSIWNTSLSTSPLLVIELWNFDHNVDFIQEFQFESVPTTITAFEAHVPIDSPASLELAAYALLIKDAVLLRDGAVLSQFYTPDGIILRNSNPLVIGSKNITAHWQKYAQEIVSMEGLQQRTTKIDEIGEYIIQHSSHIAIWRAGEYSGVNTGKHIRIWQRQADGRIKVRVLASAYDK